MASSEISPAPTKSELMAALVAVERQLELADENENPIERFFIQARLLERQDELQTELDELASPPERP